MTTRLTLSAMGLIFGTLPSGWVWAGTAYEYDSLHRLVLVTYDDGAWIRYEYDAVGNRVLDVMNSTPNVGYLYNQRRTRRQRQRAAYAG